MNTLSLDIKEDTEFGEKDLWLDLKVDGEHLPGVDNQMDAVYLPELQDSLTKSGEYLIFTCSCGVADCAGWDKVSVVHHDDRTVWNFEHDGFKNHKEFEPSEYRREIERIAELVRDRNIELEPKFVLDPE